MFWRILGGMARPALHIEVSAKDRKVLHKLVSGGVQQVRVVLRALALMQLAEGVSAPRIARMIPLTPQAIRKVGHRLLDDSQKQRVITMVCSDPPAGRARWTVQLGGRRSD